MKHFWWVASRALHATGGQKIQYLCDDFPDISVYSNTECRPHANGSGGWMCHRYSVETSWGFKKEFRTLREAKAFVENGGFEDYEISKEEQDEEHDAAGDAARCGMGL